MVSQTCPLARSPCLIDWFSRFRISDTLQTMSRWSRNWRIHPTHPCPTATNDRSEHPRENHRGKVVPWNWMRLMPRWFTFKDRMGKMEQSIAKTRTWLCLALAAFHCNKRNEYQWRSPHVLTSTANDRRWLTCTFIWLTCYIDIVIMIDQFEQT